MCDFCSRAFATVDEDVENPEYLIWKKENILGSVDLIFEVIVDDYGNLALATMGDDYHVIGIKKIKFCPICGSEIPEFTQMYRYKHQIKGA